MTPWTGEYIIGKCYEIGNGVKTNQVEALKYYKKAAESNIPYAMIRLATYYYQEEKNLTMATSYLEDAIKDGSLTAMAIYSFITEVTKLNYHRRGGDLWIDGDTLEYEEKKRNKAGSAYAGDLIDEILILWDSTVFGTAKEGFLITKDLSIVSHSDKIPSSLLDQDPKIVLDNMNFFKGKDDLKRAILKLVELVNIHIKN